MTKLTLNQMTTLGYGLNHEEVTMITGGEEGPIGDFIKKLVKEIIRDYVVDKGKEGLTVVIEGDKIMPPGVPLVNCGGWGCTIIN